MLTLQRLATEWGLSKGVKNCKFQKITKIPARLTLTGGTAAGNVGRNGRAQRIAAVVLVGSHKTALFACNCEDDEARRRL